MIQRDRPSVVVVAAAVAATVLIVLPVVGLAVQAPWSTVMTDLRQPAALTALRLSLVCSLSATALSVLLGLPLAWVLARVSFPGRRVIRALVLVPLVLPPVVGGVALLLAFGREGLVGQLLANWFGVSLQFTTAGAILAETFVAMPFFVIAAEAAFRSSDRRYEDAARTLGASPASVFRRITIPMAWPALAAGATLAWARALGEFGATITFAGRSPGRTTTIPLEVYALLDSGNRGTSVALSLVLLAIAVGVLAFLRGRSLAAS